MLWVEQKSSQNDWRETAEVETVIDALVSKSFNRDDFQKSLDRFYVAIENAAHTMPEFSAAGVDADYQVECL